MLPTSPQKFALLTSARSGSNHFMSVFQQCFRGAIVLGEIFRRAGDSVETISELTGFPAGEILSCIAHDPLRLLEAIERAQRERDAPALFFKVFYYHQPPESALWDRLQSEYSIVHLYRENLFDSFVSSAMAQQSGRWRELKSKAGDESEAPIPSIRVDPVELKAFIDTRLEQARACHAKFAGARYTLVRYSEIAASIDACVAAIAQAAGQPPPRTAVKEVLQKQKRNSNADIVSNYEDVCRFDHAYPLT